MWKDIKSQKEILKNEIGTIIKDWGGKVSVGLVYPNTYQIGMGNLAIHSLYKILNNEFDIVCERIFLPDLQTSNILSIESQKKLSEFDVIAFSISFQNDFLNIIPILDRSSIPYKKNQRNKFHPIIIAGGAAVTINPMPLANIFDAFVLGDGENIIKKIIHSIKSNDLLKIKGVFIPGKNKPNKNIVKNLDKALIQTEIHTQKAEFSNMHLIEVSRGCPRKCKFCATPQLYAPFRKRSLKSIQKMIDNGIKHKNKIGLIGSELIFHKDFFEIVKYIHEKEASFSPSSLRVDQIDNNVLKLLKKSGHKSISLGIESGSEKLRFSIGKKITNKQIINTVSLCAKHEIKSLRLYFMIGLPYETLEDIKEIIKLTKLILSIHSFSITLTINPFIPKPGTLFENKPYAKDSYLKSVLNILNKEFGKNKNVKLHHESLLSSKCDAILSNGDSNLIEFLETAYKNNSIKEAIKKNISEC